MRQLHKCNSNVTSITSIILLCGVPPAHAQQVFAYWSEMAEWQNGGMAEWWNGGMAEWRNGGISEWRNGGMAEWQSGIMYGTK